MSKKALSDSKSGEWIERKSGNGEHVMGGRYGATYPSSKCRAFPQSRPADSGDAHTKEMSILHHDPTSLDTWTLQLNTPFPYSHHLSLLNPHKYLWQHLLLLRIPLPSLLCLYHSGRNIATHISFISRGRLLVSLPTCTSIYAYPARCYIFLVIYIYLERPDYWFALGQCGRGSPQARWRRGPNPLEKYQPAEKKRSQLEYTYISEPI